MEKTLELMQDELASERRERRVESEEKNAWKDMFTKALASMQGLEKEINFKETKIAALKTRVSVLECEKVEQQNLETPLFDLNEELQPSSPMRTQRNPENELRDLKSKLEATEAYLHQTLELSIKLEKERENERQKQAVLAAEFQGLKSEVEAVLLATEAFNSAAVYSMQALTTDVRKFQAASDHKLQNLRSQVEKMDGILDVQSGVLKTMVAEQKVLRGICVARAAIQQTTSASLQQLSHLEQVCARKIQRAFCLMDTERSKNLQVCESLEPLRGVAKKHKKELIDVEKRLSAPRDIATMELCLVQGNEEHRNFLSLIEGKVMHVVANKAADQTSGSACTSHPLESCRLADKCMTKAVHLLGHKEHFKRKFNESKQQKEIVAKRSPLPPPMHGEKIWSSTVNFF